MQAADVMATDVITVTPETSVQDLAALLVRHGISGMPVVDHENALVGVVSESDLLHRAETGTERRAEKQRTHWLDAFAGADRDPARDYVKSHAQTVADVMTRDVISVSETTGLDQVADLLETHRIKRVPVMRGDGVVGIISRANLVRALAAMQNRPTASEASVDDRTIRAALLAELSKQDWARVWAADILVRDGVVHIWCADDRSLDHRQALRVAAENCPGARRGDACGLRFGAAAALIWWGLAGSRGLVSPGDGANRPRTRLASVGSAVANSVKYFLVSSRTSFRRVDAGRRLQDCRADRDTFRAGNALCARLRSSHTMAWRRLKGG